MSSALYSLSLGATNNKQKNKRDQVLFSKKSSKKGKQSLDASTIASSSKLPAELDFFSTQASGSSTKPPAPAAAPKKRRRGGSEQSDDSEGSSDEESSDDEDDLLAPVPPAQKISINGPEPLPESFTSFDGLFSGVSDHLSSLLTRNLKQNGVRSMWGVQGAVSGAMVVDKKGKGRDLIVVAPTGSGKTLSYLLPLLVNLSEPCRTYFKSSEQTSKLRGQGVRSLVILPTIELARQIQGEALKLVKGGKGWRVILLEKATEAAVVLSAPGSKEKVEEETLGIDLLIATPERLHALVNEKKLDLSSTRHLILDEADRLISTDFLDQVEPIIGACNHSQVQKVLLSATMEAGPEALARTWLREHGTRIVVGVKDAATTTVEQTLTFCGSEAGKLLALRNLIKAGSLPPPALLFVQSIERANELYKELVLDGMQVGVVHSDRTKSKREEAVRDFREGKTWMLVVTELMARGLDFKGVEVVINYDFPQTVQSYVHRIGRTGRAGRSGRAITFFTLEDGPYLRTIANIMRASGCKVETWMLELPKPSKNLKKERRKAPIMRKEVGGGGGNVGKRDINKKRDIIEASKKRKLDGKEAPLKSSKPSRAVDIDMDE